MLHDYTGIDSVLNDEAACQNHRTAEPSSNATTVALCSPRDL